MLQFWKESWTISNDSVHCTKHLNENWGDENNEIYICKSTVSYIHHKYILGLQLKESIIVQTDNQPANQSF